MLQKISHDVKLLFFLVPCGKVKSSNAISQHFHILLHYASSLKFHLILTLIEQISDNRATIRLTIHNIGFGFSSAAKICGGGGPCVVNGPHLM